MFHVAFMCCPSSVSHHETGVSKGRQKTLAVVLREWSTPTLPTGPPARTRSVRPGRSLTVANLSVFFRQHRGVRGHVLRLPGRAGEREHAEGSEGDGLRTHDRDPAQKHPPPAGGEVSAAPWTSGRCLRVGAAHCLTDRLCVCLQGCSGCGEDRQR